MRIVIDMQGAQSSGSRNRGIGRYTLALSKEMARLRGEHEVMLALNGLFPDTIEPIRAAFAELLPEENIWVWETVGPVNAADKANDARRHVAEISREAFLASLWPDIVLITSFFEAGDDSLTSICSFSHILPTAVILYDLIPLIYRNIYLVNPMIERWYLNKLDHLKRADLLLSISASSRQEVIKHLSFPAENVVNISTACDSHFKPKALDEADRTCLRNIYGLTRPFVMYTGGIDHRKNIEGLIRAYARLPKTLRREHRLVIVCSIQVQDRQRLEKLANKCGLKKQEFVLTGFVPEKDLINLYNSCKLFVFPSLHEGFGLPALEAMACGCAVIGSNTSSIPEVIGREDILFDPFDVEAITCKIAEVLTNEDIRGKLEHYSLEQARNFSWEKTAHHAWQALEDFVSKRQQEEMTPTKHRMVRRPRLAYVSPLPPEKSGIADYGAELLPELSRHYDIEVIVAQNKVSDIWVRANCPIRNVNWFRSNAHRFDRVMYHFGNSHFHSHMFDLLGEFSGVVVLHDFFLSDILAHLDILGHKPNIWAQALIHAHGWLALQRRFQAKDRVDAISAYPCSLEIWQQAQGVIVHSGYSRLLAETWYGAKLDDWAVVPLLRVPAVKTDRQAARQKLGLAEKDFVVCSFGHLAPTKLNHRLLSAWLASPMAKDSHCRLVFVGQNHAYAYGDDLIRTLRNSPVGKRIEITGWVAAEKYGTWLAAADVGVQLRAFSRGETSAAVLDCMNYGLATIVNANGSIADLAADVVRMLPDDFSEEELIEALTTLWRHTDQRRALGQRAREVIHAHHQPRRCAELYTQAIERYYHEASVGLPALIKTLADIEPALPAEDWPRLATVLANNFPPRPRRKQLLIDISILAQHDAKNGPQSVVRALLRELLLNPSEGWAVEPVNAAGDSYSYRYARRFTSRFLGVYEGWAEDEMVDAWPGDIFLGLDFQHVVVPAQKDYWFTLHRRGIKVFFVVYDLLPILLPQFFTEDHQKLHQNWIETVSHFDGAVCVSRTVADELAEWQQVHGPKRLRPFKIAWFHLGTDFQNSIRTRGLPGDATHVLEELACRPTFLMVGAVEPRKGQKQVLGAFELLWKQGVAANFIIVGKQGWMVESLAERIRQHPQLNKQLFWLDSIHDEYLEKIYTASTCLIAASEGEGSGFPLIEAARHKLPIIARDIPIFREVAAEYVYYFTGLDPHALADSIKQWLALYKEGNHPKSDHIPRLTWKESAEQLLAMILPAVQS